MADSKKTPQIIGRKSYIGLPLQGLYNVPAKIDTGADSSAIWASDIIEKEGTLYFKLFQVGSPFFTGKEIRTKRYKLISVKNSFGKAEFRYKVILVTNLEGRSVKIRYTLADRSNSSQPVLIGRRTLQGKFIVDVSLDPDKHKTRRVLFVSAKYTDSVLNLIEKTQSLMKDTEIERVTYDDMIFSTLSGVTSVRITTNGRDLTDYDIIHFKTSLQRDITAAFARYAVARGVRVLDPIVQYFPTTSKLYQYSIIVDHDVQVPDSIFVTPKRLQESFEFISEKLSLPFVLKGIHSSKGEVNDVVRNKAEFDKIAAGALKAEQFLIAQRFIPNEGDYRILTMGKQIKMIIHRSRADDSTHLNNTSAGGTARLARPNEISSEIQMKCLEMAELMGRDIAGIDMVQHSETKEWYCFEVNDGPQIATGSFKEEKQQMLAEYLQRELEK